MVSRAFVFFTTLLRASVVLGAVLTTACITKSSPSAPSAPSATGAWRLSGNIITMAGDPIAGARLVVQDGVNKDVQVATDASGQYAFASLEGGRFTVVIAAPGFVGVTPVVDLYRDLEINFALQKTQ